MRLRHGVIFLSLLTCTLALLQYFHGDDFGLGGQSEEEKHPYVVDSSSPRPKKDIKIEKQKMMMKEKVQEKEQPQERPVTPVPPLVERKNDDKPEEVKPAAATSSPRPWAHVRRVLGIASDIPQIQKLNGFSIQKQRLQYWLKLAQVHNRTLIMPPFLASIHSRELIEFDRLVSVEHLNKVFRADAMPEPAVIVQGQVSLVEPHLPARKTVHIRDIGNHESEPNLWIAAAQEEPWANPFGSDVELRRFRKKASQGFRASKPIQDVADRILGKIGKEFTCVHMRTEKDCQEWFKHPPGFYTVDQILQKISGTKASWPQIRPVVYLAGYHQAGFIERIRASGVFDNVYTKEELLEPGSAFHALSDGVPKTEAAALDYAVCLAAKSFIGNNHSSWSEAVYDDFVLAKECAQCTRQVNDLGPQSKMDALFPFCSANNATLEGISCKYYRIN